MAGGTGEGDGGDDECDRRGWVWWDRGPVENFFPKPIPIMFSHDYPLGCYASLTIDSIVHLKGYIWWTGNVGPESAVRAFGKQREIVTPDGFMDKTSQCSEEQMEVIFVHLRCFGEHDSEGGLVDGQKGYLTTCTAVRPPSPTAVHVVK